MIIVYIMGCDHLVCKKCNVAFNMEQGDAFWVFDFLKKHWHKRARFKGYFFAKKFSEFPEHLIIMHNIPKKVKSMTDPRIDENGHFHWD